MLKRSLQVGSMGKRGVQLGGWGRGGISRMAVEDEGVQDGNDSPEYLSSAHPRGGALDRLRWATMELDLS